MFEIDTRLRRHDRDDERHLLRSQPITNRDDARKVLRDELVGLLVDNEFLVGVEPAVVAGDDAAFGFVKQAVVDHRPQADAEVARRKIVVVLRLEIMRERSEEHTSELQSLMRISYAVFCLKKKK